MCLAISGRLTAINGNEGTVDYGGVAQCVDLCLLPGADIGDMVLIHAGFAIAVLNPEQGRELEALTREALFFVPPSAAEPPEQRND